MESQKLTPEQIDQLAAGPDLDALIAEKVIGLEVSEFDGQKRVLDLDPVYAPDTKVYKFPERYSTEIAAAWLVVEKLKPLRLHLIDRSDYEAGKTYWHAYMLDTKGEGVPDGHGITPALAICRAAFKTVIGGKE